MKPLEERRAKSSPYRDVAGLLRSFEYAAAMATVSGPGDMTGVEIERKRAIIEGFLVQSQISFLESYFDSAVVAHEWRDDTASTALLDLFTLEKAAYEVCYEAANRPTWIGVPLRGLSRIADRILAAPT